MNREGQELERRSRAAERNRRKRRKAKVVVQLSLLDSSVAWCSSSSLSWPRVLLGTCLTWGLFPECLGDSSVCSLRRIPFDSFASKGFRFSKDLPSFSMNSRSEKARLGEGKWRRGLDVGSEAQFATRYQANPEASSTTIERYKIATQETIIWVKEERKWLNEWLTRLQRSPELKNAQMILSSTSTL